jgi:hypothetical protein
MLVPVVVAVVPAAAQVDQARAEQYFKEVVKGLRTATPVGS